MPAMMAIVAQAQAYLAAQGIDQWQDGYPGEDVLREDIDAARGYVLVEDDAVCAIATIDFGGEPTYDVIYDGAWNTQTPYACLHRVAVDAALRGKGAADALVAAAEAVVRARGLSGVRVDTHRQNVVMQRMLARNGYRSCGVIYLESGAERIALDKILA